MVSHHHWNSTQIMPAASHAANRFVAAQQVLRRDFAYRQNDLRLNELDLPLEVVTTSRRLFRSGITIIRRPTLENIGNEHTVPTLTDRQQHLIQQLSGATDERLAPTVLLRPRRLADNQPVGISVADSKNSIRPALGQLTARTAGNTITQLLPVQACGGRSSRSWRWLIRISRLPYIDTHCLQIGLSLLFWVDHDVDREFSFRR